MTVEGPPEPPQPAPDEAPQPAPDEQPARNGAVPGRAGLVLALVIVLALGAAALVERDSADAPTVREPSGPRLPSPSSISTAWYCAEGTSAPQGRADEQVVIANLAGEPARAVMTVLPGGEAAPGVTELEVPGRSQRRVRVADVLAVPDPGVVVEVVGGRAVVSHTITGNNDVASGPCAREPSPTWYFAAGTTARGAELWLALLNPFLDDAIADVTFLTNTGVVAPEALQGLVVPGRSRVAVPVQEQARRDDLVATQVSTRRGRIVAEQSLRLDGTDGRRGLALSLGATAPADRWEFADGFAAAGRSQSVSIANPAALPASVEVRVRLDGAASLAAQPITVPPRGVVVVDLGARVPPGTGYSYAVAVTNRVPVIAEALLTTVSPVPSANRGIATTLGSPVTARRWVVLPGRLGPATADYAVVANPTGREATVVLSVLDQGAEVAPGAGELRIGPRDRAVIDLRTLPVGVDGFVVVDASGPVVVERDGQGGPGITLAPAVPALG